MAGYVDGNCRTFQAAAAIARHLRVKLNGSNLLAVAGAQEAEIGTLEEAANAANEYRSVRLRSAAGTCKMVASAAITREAIVYGAASGKIDDGTANGNPIGIALQAASGDGSVIEVLRCDGLQEMTGDDIPTVFGAGGDVEMLWSTGDASNHSMVIALGDSNQALHITDLGAKATDWNVSADTHPSIYVHSNTTPATDYLKIGSHDGTTATLDVVGGTTLSLAIAGTEAAEVNASGLQLNDDQIIDFGTGNDARMLWSTGDADNHALVLALDDTGQSLHVTDKGAQATDWNVAANTHPNVYVHSNTTPATDYLRIGDHDGTEADIDCVGGTSLALKIAGTEYASLRVTGVAVGTYVAAATAGTDQVTIKSTGTAPAGAGANVGHLYADFETDDDELFWLSGTVGTATQLTT